MKGYSYVRKKRIHVRSAAWESKKKFGVGGLSGGYFIGKKKANQVGRSERRKTSTTLLSVKKKKEEGRGIVKTSCSNTKPLPLRTGREILSNFKRRRRGERGGTGIKGRTFCLGHSRIVGGEEKICRSYLPLDPT